MRGFGGNDTYRVDNVLDKVIEATGQGTDTVITSVSYTLQPGSDVNLLRTANPAATTPLKLTGNAAAQTIQGNAGANVINGGVNARGSAIFSMGLPATTPITWTALTSPTRRLAAVPTRSMPARAMPFRPRQPWRCSPPPTRPSPRR